MDVPIYNPSVTIAMFFTPRSYKVSAQFSPAHPLPIITVSSVIISFILSFILGDLLSELKNVVFLR